MKKRNITEQEAHFINNILKYAEENPQWVKAILTPMMTLPEEYTEGTYEWMGTQSNYRRYSNLYFSGEGQGNADWFRSQSFLGFDRFKDNDENAGESYSQRKKRIITEVLGEIATLQLILLTLFSTINLKDSEEVLQDKNLLKKMVLEYSLDWARLTIHQAWVGHHREYISEPVITDLATKYMLTFRGATKEENQARMFDYVLCSPVSGTPILGLSCKSPRYVESYKKFSAHRDGSENREEAGHKAAFEKYGIQVATYVSDHTIDPDELKRRIIADIEPTLKKVIEERGI